MAGRGRRVAAPGVDPAEAQLDRREAGVGRDRRGGLERRDGAGVVAEHGAQLADRRLEARHVRVPEGERRAEVVERLAVRVDRPRPGARLAEGLGRLGVAAGGALVTGDQGEPARVVPAVRGRAQHLGDAPVQQAPPGQARRLVGGVAQARVAEVERGPALAAPDLPDEAAPHELLEGGDRLVLGPAAGRPHGREVERPPDHGARREQLAGRLGHGARRSRSRARTPRGGPSAAAAGPTARASTTYSGSPSDSSTSAGTAYAGIPGTSAAAARRATSSGPSRPSEASVTSGTRSTAAANASPRSSRSSGRHVSRTRTGRSSRRRARNRRASRDASSAHCRSSTTTRPGTVAGDEGHEHRRDRVQEPRPRGGLVVAAGVARCGREVAGDLRWQGDEPLDLAQRRRRQAGQRGRGARVGEAGAEQLDDRGVRDRALGRRRRGPRARGRPTAEIDSASASASRDLPIPASPVSTATRPRGVAASVGGDERGQLRVAPDHRQAGGSHRQGRDVRGCSRCRPVDRRRRRDRGPIVAAVAGSWASRIASYRSVVSASGATPSSRSRTATPARYWRMAPARSPARASRAISWRRAGSSSGSRSSRRDAAAMRAGQVPVGLGRRRQPLEHVPDQSLDGDRARRPPVVEVRAVAEREAGQERAARQRRPPGAGPRGRPTRRRPRAPRDRRGRRRRRGRRPSGRRRPSARRGPNAGRTACAGARSARIRRPTRATASRPARPGRRAGLRPPAGPGSRRPCGCRRRAARHRPGCRRVRGRGPRARAQGRPGRTSSPWCVTVPR